jgi:hypothetical protein
MRPHPNGDKHDPHAGPGNSATMSAAGATANSGGNGLAGRVLGDEDQDATVRQGLLLAMGEDTADQRGGLRYPPSAASCALSAGPAARPTRYPVQPGKVGASI